MKQPPSDRSSAGRSKPSPSQTTPRTVDLAVIFAVGLIYRIALLTLWPVPYGNDGFGRLFFRDHLFLSHWLPLTQAIVLACSQIWQDVFWTRVVFAVIGAAGACAFYWFLTTLVGRESAFLGGVLFSLNALYVILSLMPYQDVLFLGLFYAGFTLLVRHSHGRGWFAGCAVYGLACLTRYEAWFMIPFLVVWRAVTGTGLGMPMVRRLPKAALMFGWGPLVWFFMSITRWGSWDAFLFQTPDARFYGWRPHFDLAWVVFYAGQMLYWAVLFSSPIFLLAAAGAFDLIRGKRPVPASLKMLFGAGVLVLLFFFFIIGKRQETVFRFVGFPLSIGLVLATIGGDACLRWMQQRGWFAMTLPQPVLPVMLILALAGYSAIPVYRLNQRVEYRVPYQVAEFLVRVVGPTESVLVVADRFRDLSDAAPMDYQRIAAQVRLPRQRVLSAGVLRESDAAALHQYARSNNVRYLVIFQNFEPWQPADIYYAGLVRSRPESTRLVFSTETANVYSVESWE